MSALNLSNLQPAEGSTHNDFRRGRGHASGTTTDNHKVNIFHLFGLLDFMVNDIATIFR